MESDLQARFNIHRATAAGAGGIAVVELFGDGARAALERCFRPRRGCLPEAGEVRLGVLVDAAGRPVDEVLVAPLRASESWSGLPGWTVSCHGGAVVTEQVMEAFVERGGARRSTGEILDLAESIGALDCIRRQAYERLIQAYTPRAARYFLKQHQGALCRRLGDLLRAVEEGELAAAELRDRLDEMLNFSNEAIRLGAPLRVLIAGRANAGKSTLFNALLSCERVVVSPLPGTTRDLIEEMIEIHGYPVVLIDSAGLREESADPVERLGMELARSASCDAVLYLSDHEGPPSPEERAFLERFPESQILRVRTKGDLEPASPRALTSGALLSISAKSGAGLPELREMIRCLWLGPPERVEIPPLPFTEDLLRRFERLLESLSSGELHIDVIRQAFIKCFGKLW
ncbi:MAG: 50S ribosome-binding GTPase [Planctomycetes bacterium]|nr:50S ribosome-binding GTPase [Planctomycetota bacterium]